MNQFPMWDIARTSLKRWNPCPQAVEIGGPLNSTELNLALGLYASRNRQADFYVCASKSLSVQELLHSE